MDHADHEPQDAEPQSHEPQGNEPHGSESNRHEAHDPESHDPDPREDREPSRSNHPDPHSDHPPATWSMAVSATLHCLTGCAIGEVLGMVIGTALGWHGAATIVLAIALAFVFGYALTMRGVMRVGLTFRQALKVALAADTLSIAVMEIVDNAFMLAIPGAMDAGLADPRFWISLAAALALAFVITVPVNRWLIGRGKGHAVVHQHHH
ncbi:DUF4396 domain-containing protein [Glycomyces sp. NRRL B-16210]|uniref:DUF4396 domain-containing protein n=1 Tax=Glycomyces sp. NRRL B-16210 TaxID=1463821 RepID=UPI000B0830EB|nr:DUF4396 domain-containing protein [Glycomyces sp. NRRL B-16210]